MINVLKTLLFFAVMASAKCAVAQFSVQIQHLPVEHIATVQELKSDNDLEIQVLDDRQHTFQVDAAHIEQLLDFLNTHPNLGIIATRFSLVKFPQETQEAFAKCSYDNRKQDLINSGESSGSTNE